MPDVTPSIPGSHDNYLPLEDYSALCMTKQYLTEGEKLLFL